MQNTSTPSTVRVRAATSLMLFLLDDLIIREPTEDLHAQVSDVLHMMLSGTDADLLEDTDAPG